MELPSQRSFMHLDTVLTFIDHGTCLAHVPVTEPGRAQSAHASVIDLDAEHLAFRVCDSVESALAEVGIEVEMVPCGGDDRIDQEREQWTDGANAFAVEPGVILLYQRNRKTAEELARRGWRLLTEQDVLDGAPVVDRGRTVVTFLGNELSRARGGPRCMTMPLERDDP
jgi:arginine deiminase